MFKFFIFDILFSFLFSLSTYVLIEKMCNINKNISLILSFVIFIFIFLISSVLSYYLWNMKRKIEKLTKKIEKMSKFDEITDVYNKDFLIENLEKYFEVSKRKKIPLSIMILEIENFKSLNEKYGHEKTNKILKLVSDILKKNLRGMDIVGRYSINEFLIATFSTKEEFLNLAKRLHKLLKEIKFNNIELNINIGVTERKEEDTMNDLLKKAEEAIFLAQKKGGDRIDFLEHFLLID